MNFKITGTGSCIPDITKTNTEFLNSNFFDDDGNQIERSNPEIIDKFQSITGINERKYVSDEIKSSDLAAVAAQKAIKDSNIPREDIFVTSKLDASIKDAQKAVKAIEASLEKLGYIDLFIIHAPWPWSAMGSDCKKGNV